MIILKEIINNLFKQGDIYLDPNYTYEAGNTADKRLIILNKAYTDNQQIIAIPTTTNKDKKYKKGCNHPSWIFYLEAMQDGNFENNTIVQLYTFNKLIISEKFIERIKSGEVKYFGSLHPTTIASIMKCLRDLKDDIEINLQSLIL